MIVTRRVKQFEIGVIFNSKHVYFWKQTDFKLLFPPFSLLTERSKLLFGAWCQRCVANMLAILKNSKNHVYNWKSVEVNRKLPTHLNCQLTVVTQTNCRSIETSKTHWLIPIIFWRLTNAASESEFVGCDPKVTLRLTSVIIHPDGSRFYV